MNTFSIITDALARTENDPDKAELDEATVTTGRILAAVQTMVDTLTPPDGGRYIVGFADIGTAATSLGERRILVSSKPMKDKALSTVEKAVVIATFAAHEIGHTLVTRPRKDLVRQHNHHSGFHAVANVADDIILEPFMADRYPILADAFEFTGLWVLRTTSQLPKVHRMHKSMTTPDRFNVVLSATRYGDIADIIFLDDVTRAERDWARGWKDRLLAVKLLDHDGFLALCDELWDRIRSEADGDDMPPPENPFADDDEDEKPQPGESEDADDDEQDGDEADDDESEPGDEQGEDEGEGGSDEDADDDEADDDETEPGEGEGDDEGEDEGNPGGDESGGTKGGGTSLDGADESGELGEQPDVTDWDDDRGDEPGGDSKPEPGKGDTTGHEGGEAKDDGSKGGGGNAEANKPVRSEDDFDKKAVDESMHEQAERDPYDYGAQRIEQQVRTYASTTVTSFGTHGTMSTVWE